MIRSHNWNTNISTFKTWHFTEYSVQVQSRKTPTPPGFEPGAPCMPVEHATTQFRWLHMISNETHIYDENFTWNLAGLTEQVLWILDSLNILNNLHFWNLLSITIQVKMMIISFKTTLGENGFQIHIENGNFYTFVGQKVSFLNFFFLPISKSSQLVSFWYAWINFP